MSNRISNTLRGALPGFGRAIQAGMQGRGAYQQGFDAESALQSQLAQTAARVMQAEAAADKDAAEAEKTRFGTQLLGRRPEMVDELAALGSDSSIPLVQAVRNSLKTGQPAMQPGVQLDGPTKDGEPLGALVPAEQRSRIARQLMRLAPVLMSAGDIKVDDWAKAQGGYREMDLGDDVLAGRRTAGAVGAAQAAVAGKPLFNSDANGAVLDLFGGGLEADNPMAQSTIALRGAQAGAQWANARQSDAAAGASTAQRDKTRAEMNDGANRGGAKAPVGYRWGADGVSLEPIPGGPADPNTKGAKLAKPPTEGQAKALMFGSRMAVSDELLRELESDGATMPSLLKMGVEQMPFVGPALGMAANTVASERQQQVEQAQRDFINAVLRLESGAVISPQEFANAAQQYFARPGDSPAVLRQKAANRMTAIRGMQAEFGEAAMPQFRDIVESARRERGSAKKLPLPGAPLTTKPKEPAVDGWGIQRIS